MFRAVLPGAEGFKRTFVVKRILSHLSQSPRFVEMFIHEARTVALLNHPNIVQVYDFGNIDGTYFLAMEYLRGRDLLAIFRALRDTKRLLPIPVAAYVAHEVAVGLAYAHALTDAEGHPLDIIHRDVSPSNIMCMRTGDVKLLDFGIAKTATAVMSENTDEGTIKGKLGYMAPERVRNEAFDARSDLYSLGVVMWEMLTRRQLFRGTSMVETLKKVMELTIDPPSSLRPEVPPELDAIVMRAVERDPAKRYPTAQAMADDLEAAVHATQYQSRMLPNLLMDLFGSGLQSSQIALAGVTPELLAAAGASDMGTDGGKSTTAVVPGRRFAKWRVAALAGAALAIATVVALLVLRTGGAHVQVTPPAVSTPTLVPTPPVAPQVPAVPENTPSLAMPEKTGEAPPTKAKRITGKKAKRAVAGSKRNPIAEGLSIDPFAEAAARSKP